MAQTLYSYMYPVMLAALSGACVTALAPDKGNLKKYVKCIAGLALLAALILPFRSGFSLEAGGDDIGTYYESGELSSQDIVVGLYEERICGEIEKLAAEVCGVGSDEVSVSLTLDTSELSAIRITGISVSADDPEIQAAASEYVKALICPAGE